MLRTRMGHFSFSGGSGFCPPQQKTHNDRHCCTGFRRITFTELDERAKARYGKPREEQPHDL